MSGLQYCQINKQNGQLTMRPVNKRNLQLELLIISRRECFIEKKQQYMRESRILLPTFFLLALFGSMILGIGGFRNIGVSTLLAALALMALYTAYSVLRYALLLLPFLMVKLRYAVWQARHP